VFRPPDFDLPARGRLTAIRPGSPVAGTAPEDDAAYAMALVRSHDLPRYYATLFSPPAIRADILAIYGFAAEIARVPDQVREPALGEIRLKWWSDALLEALRREGAGEAPALRAAAGAIARHSLPLAAFEALIEARRADFYSDPPATIGDLEGRLGETESALFQMAAIASGGSGPETAEAAGHAGIAYGVARRLSQFAPDRARGRTILPADLLAEHGLSAGEIFAPAPDAALGPAVRRLADFARHHLALAQRHAAGLPSRLRPAFLPLAVVAPLLIRIERAAPAIAERAVGLSNLESLVRIGAARIRGR
jgi:15-cis-phytoene synthase